MKTEIFNQSINEYLKNLYNPINLKRIWIIDEAYKFEFANYVQKNVDFKTQTDEEILSILINSQTIKYDGSRGVQFIQKSGKETLKTFIAISDILLFRQFVNSSFESIDWSSRSMSLTVLSAWISSLFPNKIYPVPAKGFNVTINYLFETDISTFPKTGEKYIVACQEYLKSTEIELRKYPIEDIYLKVWNKYFELNPKLNIPTKQHFEQVDWNWIVQDFHLFVYRNILKLYNPNRKITSTIASNFEPIEVKEGNSKLATHMRYERNNTLIKKIKENALKANPMLNCEVCGFSFFRKYKELGQGYIEAHHNTPLHETKQTITTRDDISLLCSNCHKMIHRGISECEGNKIMTVDELKEIINA